MTVFHFTCYCKCKLCFIGSLPPIPQVLVRVGLLFMKSKLFLQGIDGYCLHACNFYHVCFNIEDGFGWRCDLNYNPFQLTHVIKKTKTIARLEKLNLQVQVHWGLLCFRKHTVKWNKKQETKHWVFTWSKSVKILQGTTHWKSK